MDRSIDRSSVGVVVVRADPLARDTFLHAKTPSKKTMSALSFSLSSKAAVSVKAVALRKNAGKAVKPRGMTVMAYKVTLETPEGTQEIECADDTYILDAAEVRWIERARGLFYPVGVGGGGAGCVQRRAWTTTTTGIGHREAGSDEGNPCDPRLAGTRAAGGFRRAASTRTDD